jgi:DNA invertase Pin-like site-specific DNA recombinase
MNQAKKVKGGWKKWNIVSCNDFDKFLERQDYERRLVEAVDQAIIKVLSIQQAASKYNISRHTIRRF